MATTDDRADIAPADVAAVEVALAALAEPWPTLRTGVAAIDAAHLRRQPPAERQLLGHRAVHRRQVEFATGRALLRRLVGTPHPILRSADRRPALPAGVVGSLAHDRAIAVGIVGPATEHRALGIDVEVQGQIGADEAAIVIRPDERHLDPTLAFVLKEAAFKAWASTSGGTMLDHHDVYLAVDRGHGEGFTATIDGAAESYSGRYIGVAGRWLALVVRPTS